MRPPSVADRKKVTPENLASLGAERLAEILVEVAETRVDLKRRLRMELAADLGPVHLVPEIDKRLTAFETSRGKITWRQKPAVLRDLDALRALIGRLALKEPDAAVERLWRFLNTASSLARRLSDREAIDVVYSRAAADLGALLITRDPRLTAETLVTAVQAAPAEGARWSPALIEHLPKATAAVALDVAGRAPAGPGWAGVLRSLADAAGNVPAYAATFSEAARGTPAVAVDIARRWLAAGEVDAAAQSLRLAAPKPSRLRGRLAPPDFDWESAWIDVLDASGDFVAAQDIRWASFQRTLDAGRLKAFTARLAGFDDVEAESRAFAYAAGHSDVARALSFLIGWPALAEAAHLIQARGDELDIDPEQAERFAGKLRRRFPMAAHRLLRRAASAAFRRREFKLSERLTQDADAITLPS